MGIARSEVLEGPGTIIPLPPGIIFENYFFKIIPGKQILIHYLLMFACNSDIYINFLENKYPPLFVPATILPVIIKRTKVYIWRIDTYKHEKL